MEENKGSKRESSLTQDYYFSDVYFNKYQLFSLSEQIYLLHKYSMLNPDIKILEVGKGNGFVSDFFKKSGIDFTTFDINENLKPDIVGDILELNLYVKKEADIVHCSEVLEHMPFEYFEQSLKSLSAASKKYVIITIPEFKKFFGLNLQIRLPKIKVFTLPLFIKSRYKKVLASGHFWEIDYVQETSRSNIEKSINKYFTIVEKGYFHSNPFHNYYVLEVK